MKVQSSVNTASDTNRPKPAASGNLSACMVAPFELDDPPPRGAVLSNILKDGYNIPFS
jgi:hypothetical protein